MKNLLWVVIALLVLDKGCELIEKAEAYKEEKSPYRNILWESQSGVAYKPAERIKVGYDWEHNMTIYQDMLDTMQMVAGKWYSKNHLPPKKVFHTKAQPQKQAQWLRPTGRDKKQFHTPEEIRAWKIARGKEQDMMQQRILDEADADDRIREIVKEELDY